MRYAFRLLARDVVSEVDQVLALERGLEASQVVDGAPDRPHVDLVIIWLSLYQFWCEVKRSANSRSHLTEAQLLNFGDAHIAELDLLGL